MIHTLLVAIVEQSVAYAAIKISRIMERIVIFQRYSL